MEKTPLSMVSSSPVRLRMTPLKLAQAPEGLDVQIERLQQERRKIKIGGALLTMTLGATCLLIGLPVLFYGLATIGHSLNTVTMLLVGSSLALPGLIAMIVGIVWFAQGISKRRLLQKEIKALQAQQRLRPNQASLFMPFPPSASPASFPIFSLHF